MTAPDRAEVIAVHRRVLDLTESNPQVPLPYLRPDGVHWYVTAERRPAAAMAAIEAALPCEMTGSVEGGKYLLSGVLAGVAVEVEAYAADVADRKVTGTRVVEDVEWVRKPAEPQDAAEGEARS